MNEWALRYWLRTPANQAILRAALAEGRPVKFVCPANDDTAEPSFCIRPLGETDVRVIARENGPLLGAVIDTSPTFDVTATYVLTVLRRVLLDQVHMLREIVWRGSWLERSEVCGLPWDELLSASAAIIGETRSVHREGRLEAAIIDVLTPYSAYLRGEFTA